MADIPNQTTSNPFNIDNAIQGAETATSMVNQYIVAPIQGLGIAGFNLSITKVIKSEIACDITDQYVETNSARQDNIAIKPEKITITGQVGELVYENTKAQSNLQKLAAKLTTIAGYLPILTNTMKQLQNGVLADQDGAKGYFDAALGNGIDLYQTFKRLNPPKTNQAKAANYFYALINARQLISFDTPYGFKANFAIENFVISQPEKTAGYSDVEFVLKQFRTVTTKIVPFDPNKYQGRTAGQTAPKVNGGNSQGSAPTDGNAATKAFDLLKKF